MKIRDDFITLKNLILKPKSNLQIITKGGISVKTPCAMDAEDFLTSYNKRKKVITFATGIGTFCRLNKKEIAVLTVEPFDTQDPFQDLN